MARITRKASRRLSFGLLAAALAGIGGYMGIQHFPPELQSTKHKVAPFLETDERYTLPTAAEPFRVSPVVKPTIVNERSTLEDQVAELIVTSPDNLGTHYPGGVLLTKEETRKGHLFGRYGSYDPAHTTESVQDILRDAAAARKRLLIYDEGEGGYVMRIGTLPAAGDIGRYYAGNEISGTLIGRVTPHQDQARRESEIRRLFGDYARELRARGVDAVFGPVLDVVSTSHDTNVVRRDGRNFSHLHSDTRAIARLYIAAMHEQGIRVTGKHFLTLGLIRDEDVHDEEAVNTDKIQPRRWSGQTYRVLRDDLDAAMVSHVGNPVDDCRPYSISGRAISYLTQPTADRNRKGIDFHGLVVTDDLSMGGLLRYLDHARLTAREEALVADCTTPEARAAVLAIDAGAHVLVALRADTDAIVRGVSSAYRLDNEFRDRVNSARFHYGQFVRGHR